MNTKNKQRSARRWRKRAVTLVWAALCGSIIIGFMGLALDWGHVYYAGQQLQVAADAAALAGARLVKTDVSANFRNTRTAAHDIALLNNVALNPLQLAMNEDNVGEVVYIYGPRNPSDTSGDIVVGRVDMNTRAFTPNTDRPNAVRVVGRRTEGSLSGSLPLVFARSFGLSNSNVARDAIATMGAGMGAGLIVLNHTQPCSLRMDGGGELHVVPVDPPQTCEDGAGIWVNSSAGNAACVDSNGEIVTTSLSINGWYDGVFSSVTEGACGSATGDTLIHQNTGKIIPDPLAGVPEPSTSGMTDLAPNKPIKVQNSDTVVLGPGWYSKGINATGGSLTLQPGIYILGGNASGNNGATGLSMSGGSSLCAKGVCLFVLGPYGNLDLEGTGATEISPIDFDQSGSYFCNPSYSYPATSPNPLNSYEGIAVFQSRSNFNQAKIGGGSDFVLDGTYYFPDNQVKFSGVCTNGGTQLICDTVWFTGTSNVDILYDGRNPAAGATTVFLVQ